MRHAIILAQSEPTATALRACWHLAQSRYAQSSQSDDGLHPNDEPLRLVCEHAAQETSDTYRYLAARISLFIEGRTYTNDSLVVLVDHIQPGRLNPMKSGWSPLIAMLILTFPDLDWHFGTLPEGSDECEFPYRHCSLPALFENTLDSLFDYSRLRDWVRSITRGTRDSEKRRIAPPFPVRAKLAVAIDDERSYAYFHAYAAYRFGFRSLPVTTERAADQWFKKKIYPHETPFLALEDLFLNFPDRKDHGDSISDLENRAKRWPKLEGEKTVFRIFVTSGQRHSGDDEKRARNRAYMREPYRVCSQYRRCALKPTGGIFDLWHETGLDRKKKYGNGKIFNGVGPGFVWPPSPQRQFDGDSGHSAPGRLLLISEHLLARCERILNRGVKSVEEAVRGAVIAGSALELLGDRTPTTGIQALSMKHQFEVLAECQFSGVEYHLLVKPRLEEIRQEVRAIGHWFSRRKRKDTVLNAEMMIVNSLITIFRQHNQFEEEQLCMNRARHLHNTLWMRQRSRRLPMRWRYAFWPVLRYSETLLGSIPRFMLGLTIWTVVLGALFSIADRHLDIDAASDLNLHPVSMVLTTFFGAGSLVDVHPYWMILTFIAVLGGLAHLGIFISHLYSVVSRK